MDLCAAILEEVGVKKLEQHQNIPFWLWEVSFFF